jgi:hypothetical protein
MLYTFGGDPIKNEFDQIKTRKNKKQMSDGMTNEAEPFVPLPS